MKGFNDPLFPIIQGGMGAGISLAPLVSGVMNAEGIGTLSSVALDRIHPIRKGIQLSDFKTTAKLANASPQTYGVMKEIEEARGERPFNQGFVAINIMCALYNSFEESVEGAVRAGANMIVSGAGLPRNLTDLVNKYINIYRDDLPEGVLNPDGSHNINLVPIISSGTAFKLICRMWEKKGYVPDAVVLEGPKAGGHLGFFYKDMPKNDDGRILEQKFLQKYDLFEELLIPVLEVAKEYGKNGPIPVYVAGGFYTNENISYALSIDGVEGVQMGTRFAATKESTGCNKFKEAYLHTKKEDIYILPDGRGSPCGFPFRVTRQSELDFNNLKDNICICSALFSSYGQKSNLSLDCPFGYVINPKKKGPCSAAGYASNKTVVTCGTEAYKVNEIMPVKKLMNELINR